MYQAQNSMAAKKKPAKDQIEVLIQNKKITHNTKPTTTCDVVFATYLTFLAQHVNEMFYNMAIMHILLYRSCLNEHGHQKFTESN